MSRQRSTRLSEMFYISVVLKMERHGTIAERIPLKLFPTLLPLSNSSTIKIMFLKLTLLILKKLKPRTEAEGKFST